MDKKQDDEVENSSARNKEPPNSKRDSFRSPASRTMSGQRSNFGSLGRSFANGAGSSWINDSDLPAELERKCQTAELDIRPTWKRYIILILFCLNAGNKSYQWIQISASTVKATQFYQVENYVINATSIVFMLSFIVLSWPACLLIERIGLRKSILLASFGTAVGSIVKCFSCGSNQQSGEGIILLMISQILVSLSEQLIFSLPARLASVWFPDDEVSSAVSWCCLGSVAGVAIGFLVPQYFLGPAHSVEEIGQGFFKMFLITAAFSVFAFVIDYLLIDEEPEFAPGLARWKQRELERSMQRQTGSFCSQVSSLMAQIGSVLKNRDSVLLLLSYGVNIGSIINSIPTLLDQMLIHVWPNDEQVVGVTGFLLIVSGTGGLYLSGRIMDKWHAYKSINIWLVLGSAGSQILFAYTLVYMRSIWGVYISAALLGTFSSSLIATGLEFAVELTYPAPELVTASLMNVMPQIFGTVFIIIGSYIVDKFGALATNIFFLMCLLCGLLLMALTREILRRQQAIEDQERAKPTSMPAKSSPTIAA